MQPNFWGQLIKNLRTEQHLSQRKLSQGTGVNRSTLRRIEEGSSSNDIEMIETLLHFLGYELEAISVANKAQLAQRYNNLFPDEAARSRLAAKRLLQINL